MQYSTPLAIRVYLSSHCFSHSCWLPMLAKVQHWCLCHSYSWFKFYKSWQEMFHVLKHSGLFSTSAYLHPTWRPLIWLCVVCCFIYNPQYNVRDPSPRLLVWQLHSCKQTQFNLQQSVRVFPAQWGLCGFSGCALDVVCVPPGAQSMSSGCHPFHFITLSANKEHFRFSGFCSCRMSKFWSLVSCPAVSGGDWIYFELGVLR